MWTNTNLLKAKISVKKSLKIIFIFEYIKSKYNFVNIQLSFYKKVNKTKMTFLFLSVFLDVQKYG